MSISTYNTFSESGLTTLAEHIKATRAKALSNEGAITGLGEDLAGLSEEVVNALAGKAPIEHAHDAADVAFTDGQTFQQKYDSGELNGPKGDKGDTGATGETGPAGADGEDGEIPIITATSTDGVSYIATVDGMDSLEVGKELMLIPNMTSTAVNPTLNVNGLGAKYLRCPLNTNNTTTSTATNANWIYTGKPVKVRWNGTFWVTDIYRIDTSTFYNAVPITKGGTGATDAATARENLGINSPEVKMATIDTTWIENTDTGVKSQTVTIDGVTVDHTAKVDVYYNGDGTSDSYATFVEQQNQFLEFVTNGYAETVEGGITFYIFGDVSTVSIPILVEVV